MRVRDPIADTIYQKLMDLINPGRKKRYREKYCGRYGLEIAMHKQLLRLAFPEEARAKDKERRQKTHPNYPTRRLCMIEANRRYQKRYPERTLAQCRVYQARKRAAIIGDRKAIRAVYRRAKELRQWFDVVVDHIIPLKEGGAHSAQNLQIIYRKENRLKWAWLDYRPSVIFV